MSDSPTATRPGPSGDQPAEARYVDVGGISTRYYDEGQGHPLVLLHGGDFRSASTADDWSLNWPTLAKRFRVIALDKLGQGFTGLPATETDYTMSATADHLAGFLDALGLDDVTLVGHSRGALPAARVALDRPDSIRSLVIFSSNTLAPEHPATPVDFYPTAFANRPAVPDEEYVRREPVMNSYSIAHVDEALIAHRLEVARLAKTTEAIAIMARRYGDQFVPDQKRVREDVLTRIGQGGLQCPVQIIWGRDDPSAPLVLGLELFDLIASKVADTELHVVNQSGHYAYREQPDACNTVVAGFVERVLAGR